MPAIQAALQAADKAKKRLLVIDEAQVLAAPEHRAIAHSLRAGLDIRKASIKVLFAAPFYHWAPLEPFPLLGREFVEAMVTQLASVARCPLDLDEALRAFAALNETPEFFRWYVERYLLYQRQGPELALQKRWRGCTTTAAMPRPGKPCTVPTAPCCCWRPVACRTCTVPRR